MTNPGPGTYRINYEAGRIIRDGDCMFDSCKFAFYSYSYPACTLHDKQSCCSKGGWFHVCLAPGHRDLPEEGVGLPPGYYPQKGFVEEICNKLVSTVGPYNTYSGDRCDRVNTGSSRILKKTSETQDKPCIAPGMLYFIRCFDSMDIISVIRFCSVLRTGAIFQECTVQNGRWSAMSDGKRKDSKKQRYGTSRRSSPPTLLCFLQTTIQVRQRSIQ